MNHKEYVPNDYKWLYIFFPLVPYIFYNGKLRKYAMWPKWIGMTNKQLFGTMFLSTLFWDLILNMAPAPDSVPYSKLWKRGQSQILFYIKKCAYDASSRFSYIFTNLNVWPARILGQPQVQFQIKVFKFWIHDQPQIQLYFQSLNMELILTLDWRLSPYIAGRSLGPFFFTGSCSWPPFFNLYGPCFSAGSSFSSIQFISILFTVVTLISLHIYMQSMNK